MKKIDFISAFLVFAICTVGLFHEYLACFAGLVLCVYLFVTILKNNKIEIYFNSCFVSVAVIVVSYGICSFWAIDSGMAFIGFFKFFPLFMFLIVIMQSEKNSENYFDILPYVATIMTVLSAIFIQIPSLEKWFSVSGRLSGFFQYSNTFAIFLLVSLIILATKEKLNGIDFLQIFIIVFGIVYSGSRTVFALMLFAVLVLFLFNKNKKIKIILFTVIALVIVFALIYVGYTKDFRSIGRFLTVSLQESTFVGRLLYFMDALPVILRNPFGMGYLGYYYYQHSIQSGVYTVKFIHNDFLQLLLDVGWLPVIVFLIAIIKSFFKKGTSLQKRLLILVVSAHTCFDFNFQYLAILMLFIMMLDYKEGRKIEINTCKFLGLFISTLCSILFIYMGVSQALSYYNQYELSDKLYPYNTQNHFMMITKEPDLSKCEYLADKIINNNGYIAIAYDVKAKLSYAKGDFANMIKYKEQAIKASPLTYETYEDYCYMLINGIYLYEKSDDIYSVEVCKQKLIEAVDSLTNNTDKLSHLGKMIDDQPKTELPEDIINYVEMLRCEEE